MKTKVRIEHDDQPHDVAEHFAATLKTVGVKVVQVAPADDEQTWIDWEIYVPDRPASP